MIVTVPSSAKGVHTIQAIGPITASAARPKQSYVIGPILALSKSTGHVAMGVEVRGRGFEPLSTVDLNVSDVRQASLVTDDTGSFEFTDKIPALASGKHIFFGSRSIRQPGSIHLCCGEHTTGGTNLDFAADRRKGWPVRGG